MQNVFSGPVLWLVLLFALPNTQKGGTAPHNAFFVIKTMAQNWGGTS